MVGYLRSFQGAGPEAGRADAARFVIGYRPLRPGAVPGGRIAVGGGGRARFAPHGVGARAGARTDGGRPEVPGAVAPIGVRVRGRGSRTWATGGSEVS